MHVFALGGSCRVILQMAIDQPFLERSQSDSMMGISHTSTENLSGCEWADRM